MPSVEHEIVVELLRGAPELVPELLARAGGAAPAHDRVVVGSADLTQAVPAEYHADLVVLLYRGDIVVCAVVVEIQLGRDDDKRFSWPAYGAQARARFRCPAVVMVVTVEDKTARWARRPIELGGGNMFSPIVLAPQQVPLLDDPSEVRARPLLGVLAVLAHGRDHARARHLATTAREALICLVGDKQYEFYYDLMWASLSPAARKVFSAMFTGDYIFKHPELRKSQLEGEAKGKIAGKAAALRLLLVQKFGPLSPDAETRISAADGTALDQWLERVLMAASVDEILA